MLKWFLLCAVFQTSSQFYTAEFLEKLPPVDFCLADTNNTNIVLYLFKSACQKQAIIVNDGYTFSEDDKKLPLKILIHGYTSNVTSPWFKEMKNAFYENGPHNVIYVDWGEAANMAFPISAANSKPVGEMVAEKILQMKVPLENVHLIGHSLGAQMAGFVGKHILFKTGKKISRITATDAAGPAFEKVGPESRLSLDDATFVDVIHTDVGYFGIRKPIGHVDFYPNDGLIQPGCPKRDDNENCSHARSNQYFTESINTKNVFATSATFNEGKIVTLNKDDVVEFGNSTPFTTRGIYSFKTNSREPFLIPKTIKKI